MPIIDKNNSGFQINGVDIANTASVGTSAGFVSKDYLISVYPSLFALLTTAGLYGVGFDASGELGDNSTTTKSSVVATVAVGYNWKSLTCNATDSVIGIKHDGSLWAWGNNRSGKLGDNSSTNRSSPVQTAAGGSNWESAAMGYNLAAGIKADGTLWTWGSNQFGQLGAGAVGHRSSPAQTVAAGTNWKQVSIGIGFIGAVKTDGTLWTWGYNQTGQLGDNSSVHRSSPVQTLAGGTNWRQISCGGSHTAAVKDDGTLWTWGWNNRGALGDGTTSTRSSPVQTIAGGNDWSLVSCGDDHTTAIKMDGTLWVWGHNQYGRLGNNDPNHKSSPVQTVAGGTNWKLVSGGSYHTMALKTDGTMWGWGRNNAGQLGDNSTTNRSSPVQSSDRGSNWVSVAAGALNSHGIRDDSDFQS
jgi:alpha-tubulin suppressor-like RCC1 family protein